MLRRWGVFWGIALVAFGGLLLADQLGLLPVSAFAIVGPLFVVLVGVWLIAGAFGRGPGGTTPTERFAVPLEGARAARVVIRHGAGRLAIGGGATPGNLVEGDAVGGVTHRDTRSTDALTTELSPAEDWTRWSGFPHGGLEWRLALAEGVPLALDLYVGASENDIDLTRLSVSDLRLETGASSTLVRLPATGSSRMVVKSGAASVRFVAPPNVAVRLIASGALSDIQAAPRFVRGVNGWESPDFATSADRVEISVEMGVGSVRLD